MIGNYIHFVFSKLRVNDAWRYKVPVLISIPYIIVALWYIPALVAIKFIFFSFATIIGIASYAYLLNDWADIEKDSVAGKPNAVAGLSNGTRILLFVLFLALAITPWFFFPFTRLTIGLLILELVLFAAYSFPPVRLKEKPIPGIITDTLYAHVLPCILAALTFIAIARENEHGVYLYSQFVFFTPWFLCFIAAWQFFLGVRNILLHQIEDAGNDLASGTTTLVTTYGAATIRPFLIICLVLETLSVAAFICLLPMLDNWIGAAYLIYLITLAISYKSSLFKVNARTAAYRFLDDFYYQWLALPVLAWLCYVDLRFGILAALHILLFDNAIKNMLKRVLNK